MSLIVCGRAFCIPIINDFDRFFIKILSDRLNYVEEKIREPKKDSKNSSISSSHDMKRQAESKGSAKKKGAKTGHKGYGRKLKLKADEEIKCLIEINPRTGEKIDSQSESFQVNQIIDIDPMKTKVINILRQVTTGIEILSL